MPVRSIDVARISDAIARPDRRKLAVGMAWSLPAIAIGIAAPTHAASTGQTCIACDGAYQCILTIGGAGTCSCGPGLACVGTGPLGLANVCVGSTLVATTCGPTTCYGVCLDPGGAVIVAFNILMSAMTAFVSTVATLVAAAPAGLSTCVNQPGLPSNVCVSPLNDGGLGAMCIERANCGNTTLIGTALATLDAAVTTYTSTLASLGIIVATSCQAPYVCKDGGSVAVSYVGSVLPPIAAFGSRTRVGICQCGPQDTCPKTFTVC